MTHSTRYECTNDEMSATNIPDDRHWYSIKETAHKLGISETFLRDGIRKGQRRNPPPDAITCVRKFGTQWRIHRSYIFTDEIANVIPLHGGVTDAQLQAAANHLFDTILDRLNELRRTQPQRRSA